MKVDVKRLTKLNNGWHVRLQNDFVKMSDLRYVQVSYLDGDTVVIKKLNLVSPK